MQHCSPDELMDVVEGQRPADTLPHLAACEICRAQIVELRALMTAVGEVAVPEPSPLFWDHLAGRVREAVTAEAPPTLPLWSRVAARMTWRPMWSTVAVAATVVLVVLVALGAPPNPSDRSGGTAALPTAAVAPSVTEAASGSLPVGPEIGATDEPLLTFLEDLAADIDFDTAISAGLTLDRLTADAAVGGLSGDEQVELQRLLREALAGSGV